MTLLSLTDVGAGYGGFHALHDVSMEIRRGESVAVIGANGAGKTTLLRVISGMIPATGGRIEMEGVDLTRLAPHRVLETGIAHVPENRRLFPRLTVEQNLRLGAFVASARPHLRRRLDYVYGLFPRLAERRRQFAGTMSGGEQQLCAIGRALMSGPKLVLLDEPSTGLAPVVVSQIFDLVRKIRADGYTVLIVEQNVAQVLGVVDRAYLLSVGRIRSSGTADEMRRSEAVQKAYLGM